VQPAEEGVPVAVMMDAEVLFEPVLVKV